MKARYALPALAAALALFAALLPPAGAASAPVTLTDPSTEPAFCRIDLGTATQASDDTFYLSLDGDDDLIEINDIRLTAFGTKGPGTLVTSTDTSETVAADCQAMTIAYYDGDHNGRYTVGDYLYVGYNKATTQLVEGTTNTGDYWIRVTAYPAGPAAGTIVLAGDADLAGYVGGTAVTGAEYAIWDKDASGGFNAGDVAYLAAKAVATGDHLPVASGRIVNATYAYGSLAAIGDSDVNLALTDPSTDPALCRIDAGTTGVLNDDGFYLSMDGDDDQVEAQDLRLVAYGSKAAGSVVTNSDTTEIAAATCQAYTVAYYDVDHSGTYTAGDGVLIGYDKATTTLVQPSASDGDWWIRLTPSGSLEAGTLLNGGDADYGANTGGSALTGAEFAYYDMDASTTFTVNDLGYITAAAVDTGKRPPTNSTRVSGLLYAFGTIVKDGDRDGLYLAAATTTPTSTTSSSASSSATSSTSASTSSSAATSSSSESSAAKTKPTPGFELVVVLAALGAVLVAVARRRT
jgi:hypothetical protein